MHLQHRAFIVTSNFTIEELFGENEQIMQAIKRRFTVLKFGAHVFNPAWQHIVPGLAEQEGIDNEFLSELDNWEEDIDTTLLGMGAF